MNNVYRDKIIKMDQYSIEAGEDIFERILKERKGNIDEKRFFLSYISSEELAKYDFSNTESLKEFRKQCILMEPLKRMGGCNLKKEKLDQDIRYTGIKISDPCGKIPGVFDLTNHIITYSPIFPFFYDERDLVKFADDTYFTSMTFEEIIINEIEISNEYYVHTGNYKSSKDILKYGSYIYEQIDKAQMIEYATNPEKGYQLIKKHVTNMSGNH